MAARGGDKTNGNGEEQIVEVCNVCIGLHSNSIFLFYIHNI